MFDSAAGAAKKPVEKAAPEAPQATTPEAEPVAPAPSGDESAARVITSPAIRRRAKEAGIDLNLVPGSGAGGRIQRRDFDNYLKASATGTPLAK